MNTYKCRASPKRKGSNCIWSQSGSYPHTSRGSEKASSRAPSNKPEECSGVGNCFTSLVEVLVVAVVEVLVMVVLIVAVVVLVSQSLSTWLELESLWSSCQELTQRLKISDMAQTKNVDRLPKGATWSNQSTKWKLRKVQHPEWRIKRCLCQSSPLCAAESLRHCKD